MVYLLGSCEARLPVRRCFPMVCVCLVLGLFTGLLGDVLISGEEQGRRVAELAMQILDGATPDDLPVARDSLNVPMFNYGRLQRFDIPLPLSQLSPRHLGFCHLADGVHRCAGVRYAAAA